MNEFFNALWFNTKWFNENFFSIVNGDTEMAVEQLRQGTGLERIIHAEAPTEREDGTPLALDEIQGYGWYISFDGATHESIGVTQLVGGAFVDVIDVDSQTPGIYDIYYTTIDNQVLPQESVPSVSLALEILAPLKAAPNPPSGVA